MTGTFIERIAVARVDAHNSDQPEHGRRLFGHHSSEDRTALSLRTAMTTVKKCCQRRCRLYFDWSRRQFPSGSEGQRLRLGTGPPTQSWSSTISEFRPSNPTARRTPFRKAIFAMPVGPCCLASLWRLTCAVHETSSAPAQRIRVEPTESQAKAFRAFFVVLIVIIAAATVLIALGENLRLAAAVEPDTQISACRPIQTGSRRIHSAVPRASSMVSRPAISRVQLALPFLTLQ